MNPPLAGDCWLCLSSGPLHYTTAPVIPLNQSMHDATPNSTSMKPKVSSIQLSQRDPNCIYNSRGYYPVGELAASQCAQIQNSTTTAMSVQLTDHDAAAQEHSLYAGPLLISACQHLHISLPHPPDKHSA
jgi:hypothetical protein